MFFETTGRNVIEDEKSHFKSMQFLENIFKYFRLKKLSSQRLPVRQGFNFCESFDSHLFPEKRKRKQIMNALTSGSDEGRVRLR